MGWGTSNRPQHAVGAYAGPYNKALNPEALNLNHPLQLLCVSQVPSHLSSAFPLDSPCLLGTLNPKATPVVWVDPQDSGGEEAESRGSICAGFS